MQRIPDVAQEAEGLPEAVAEGRSVRAGPAPQSPGRQPQVLHPRPVQHGKSQAARPGRGTGVRRRSFRGEGRLRRVPDRFAYRFAPDECPNLLNLLPA